MTMTTQEVRTLLVRTIGNRSVREMATEMKVSAGYLYDVLKGARDPGPSVLAYLGLKKTVQTTVTYHLTKRKTQ